MAVGQEAYFSGVHWKMPAATSSRPPRMGLLLTMPYGPLYSNSPMRDDRPVYAKLMFGSVNFSIVERRT